MIRTNKKTRIKGLPPKIQLQLKDAATGSFPSEVRVSSDNRTGTYSVNWNDRNVVVFGNSGTGEIYLGAGLPTTSLYWNTAALVDLAMDYSTSLSQSGKTIKGVGDNLAHFTPGQSLTPFVEHNIFAADGKSLQNQFYTTGSDTKLFGSDLQQPLWSKSKIEIDISVATQCSATLFVSGADWVRATRPSTDTDGLSYEMLYYNFDSKIWQGIGTGTPTGFVTQGAANIAPPKPFGNHVMYGFTPGIVGSNVTATSASVTGAFAFMNNAGRPTNTFGFPFHPKFHATSSQVLDLSNYISSPFLVEKIVVELSAAYTVFAETMTTSALGVTTLESCIIPAAINNFFILNQRPQVKFSYTDSYDILGTDDGTQVTEVPTMVTLSAGGSAQRVTSIRDIIAWGGISSFATNMPTTSSRQPGSYYYGAPTTSRTDHPKALMTRDFVFNSSLEAKNDLTALSWDGKIKLELVVSSPNKNSKFDEPTFDIISGGDLSNYIMRFQAGPSTYIEGVTINYNGPFINYKNGNRNGLGLLFPTGRSRSSEITSIQVREMIDETVSATDIIEVSPGGFAQPNPYLLLPNDKLVIGWQQPITDYIKGETVLSGKRLSEIKFPPGPAKIILYGTQLKENKEHNDTLNQLLISNSVHEVIQ